MPVTLIVEPSPLGHRFQAVANVARVAVRAGDVLLLTSRGAKATAEFETFLTGEPLAVAEEFGDILPSAQELARAVGEYCRSHDVGTVVLMDADTPLKRWWYVAPRQLRGVRRRPRIVFMLTRYPARVPLTDGHGWFMRVSKGSLALAAMATRSLHRVGGFAGRDDLSEGLLVKRLRDPAICSAHSRDRAAIRAELGLPAERRLVGILGVIDVRKSPGLVLEATLASADDADLLLAGTVRDDVAGWLATLRPEQRARIVLREGFLSDDELDKLVAACDVITVAQLNKGPSGIMGKALAAEVPVVSAGSQVRARELAATRAGIAAEMTVASIADALRRLYAERGWRVPAGSVPPATGETFALALLGVDADGRVAGRR